MIIIGITGTLGAGKGTIVDYLCERHRFTHYSVRSFLIEELMKRGESINRDSMVHLANELRAQHHPAYIIEQLYAKANEQRHNCIIESIRTPGEVDALENKQNFYLLAVDADAKTRYERIYERGSETDTISFETFLDNEAREMENTDPNKQNLKVCMQRAQFKLENNGNLENLYHQIENIIQQIQ